MIKKQGRVFVSGISREVKELLSKLNDKQEVVEYKKNMFLIGMKMGEQILVREPRCKYFYIVCTVEDADFLAKGIMETLKLNNVGFNMACFWNSRETAGELGRISPVLRKYVEPHISMPNARMIVVKSLISGSCVVKTNIKEMVNEIKPKKIYIAAPVIHKDAKNKLKSEFNDSTIKKFDFIYYATDSEKIKGIVRPGLGNVYKQLGLKNQTYKNKHTPLVVQERRSYYL